MAPRRVASRPGRLRGAPVPFFLAASRPPAARARPGVRLQLRLRRLARLWQALVPLEEAAWAGALSPRGLARLQRTRVAYARLFAEGTGGAE